MQAWSDYCASPQGAGKVVSMKSRTEASQQQCIRLRLGDRRDLQAHDDVVMATVHIMPSLKTKMRS